MTRRKVGPQHDRPGWERDPLTGARRLDHDVTVAVLVYRGVTTAEVELPVERLSRTLRADVVFVGDAVGAVPGVEPARDVIVDATPSDDVRPDVLIVPGGLGWRQIADDEQLAAWLVVAADSARAILAISTGSLLLAAAGRLTGLDATGHWLASSDLARLGAHVSPARTVIADAGRLVTASGVHAAGPAIDRIAERLAWGPVAGGRSGGPPRAHENE